jgi:hypothetical protein
MRIFMHEVVSQASRAWRSPPAAIVTSSDVFSVCIAIELLPSLYPIPRGLGWAFQAANHAQDYFPEPLVYAFRRELTAWSF